MNQRANIGRDSAVATDDSVGVAGLNTDAAAVRMPARQLAPQTHGAGRSLTHPGVGFVAVCLGYAIAMFHRTAFAELAPLLGEEVGLSAARLGWIASSFFWVYLLTQIPAGLLLDAVGPRRMSAWACAAMALGAAGSALASTPVPLAAARGLCAAGAVAIFLSMIAYCRECVPEHANAILGRGLMIGNLGGIASGAPLGLALELLHWRDIWWLMAVVAALSSLVLLMTMPERERSEAPAQSLRHALPSFLRSMHRSDVYLGAGALAGLAEPSTASQALARTNWLLRWVSTCKVRGSRCR